MGTCYYFARTDNHTLFDMDKAYRIRCQLTTGDVVDGNLDAITMALRRVDEVLGAEEAKALCEAVHAWSGGHEMVFLSEQDVEENEWRDADGELRITGDRFAAVPVTP